MDRELTRYRNGAITFMLTLILGALSIFGITEANKSTQTDRESDRRNCQMAAVVGGASLEQAEQLCGRV
jgi:hypothetical protein